jgi:hypothetical protein
MVLVLKDGVLQSLYSANRTESRFEFRIGLFVAIRIPEESEDIHDYPAEREKASSSFAQRQK